MNKSMLALGLISLFGSAQAGDFTDTAKVISSKPIYERVTEPKRECWTETVQVTPKERSVGGAVVGGVAGGVLGSQVGSGHGSTAATAAGAVAGTIAGDRVANPDENRSMTGAVVGGVAGAILGSQVGGGSGNKAATAAGAIAGTLIGDRIANPATPRTERVERCREVETMREVIKGYEVTYLYDGREFTTTLPYKPGRTLRVRVNVGVDGGEGRSHDKDRHDDDDDEYRKRYDRR